MEVCTVEQESRVCRVMLTGDLTASGVAEVQAKLQAALGEGAQEIVFDLGKALMIDSSGIGLLIAASNSLAGRNGRIRVVKLSAEMLQLFNSMRLTHRLNATGAEA